MPGWQLPAVSWRWPRAPRRSWHGAGTEAAGAAAGISGDEAALPPGFYLFLLSEKKKKIKSKNQPNPTEAAVNK